MQEETELAMACRTLGLYADSFERAEVELTGASCSPDAGGEPGGAPGGAPGGGLRYCWDDGAWSTLLNPDHCATAPVRGRAAAPGPLGGPDVRWEADGPADSVEDLLSLMREVHSGGFPEDIAHLFSADARDSSFCPDADRGVTLGIGENIFRAAYSAKTDGLQHGELEERPDAHWGVKMQDLDQDPYISSNWGDLPEDLSEFLNDDFLVNFGVSYLDTDVLFDDPLLTCEDELSTCTALPTASELPDQESQREAQRDKTTNNRRKRPRVPRAQRCTDENTPSRSKRQRAAARPRTKVAQTQSPVTQGADTEESEASSAETTGLSATPPRVVHVHPSSIQFITIPDTSAYQVVGTLRLSHPVLRLPIPNTAAAPTYILVPAASPPFKQQEPPLSPMNGAVAPVQMSSPPLGSLSDTKAMSPHWALPLSPNNEMSTCKESPLPQSPTALDIPQVVKDYIQKAKAHVSQPGQDTESGLGLSSRYVDVQVSRREILRSGKNANKVLDKDLVITGDTDRQKSCLGHMQIFEGLNGDKPKCYILLLGNAGMGKTTLVRKLCLDWSMNCLPQFDFVFVLDGKALSLSAATHSLQTLLLDSSSFAAPCADPEAVYAQILAAPKRVLVVFDGFDELRDFEILLQTQEKDSMTSLQKDSKARAYTVRQLYSAVLQRLLLPGCTLLLATRPRGAASQLLRRTDSLLEVCGFTPTNVETYISRYFTDPDVGAAALNCLKNCSYLRLLCWNPGLCRLVCLVLERCKSFEDLPRTLTGLCHRVLRLKLEKDESQSEVSVQPEEEEQISGSSLEKRRQKNTRTKPGALVRTRTRSTKGSKKQEEDGGDVDGVGIKSVGGEVDKADREMLSQLSCLAWKGVKANSSILPTEWAVSAELEAFGRRTGLISSYHPRPREVASSDETGGGGRPDREEMARRKIGEKRGKKGRTSTEHVDVSDDHILSWANPFLQSYLAAVHLSLSRSVTDRAFLQTLPFQSGQKERRRPQREELELTQRFAVGLLFHDRTELPRLHSYTEASFGDMVVAKQALATRHLEGLSHGDLSPAQVLEACHHVYEASFTRGGGSRDGGGERLVAHLAANLPEVLTFRGVPLKPSDVFAVQNVLEKGGAEGRRFSLDLEDSGIQISGLEALVGLNNIYTYRACIADVIALWEQLEQNGQEVLLREAVSKFKIHPLKATQACHIEHLAKLVNIHTHRRLPDSSSQSESILAEGVPAVKELHKLQLELGPEKSPQVLLKLWELLPGLHNLQHLDLENSKIGDKGAEQLADALSSLGSLEILNLPQNCIGDQGVKKLETALRNLPKLHCLSLYSNEISDEGAEILADVLPHMASLTDLDVKYNKLTDVGAQILGASLRNCKKMKTLRMWNQCIPYGVLERLQQQDSRIQWQ